MQPSTANGARIVLVRHARSSHVHNGWIDADGFRSWRDAYDAAGIRNDERAPAELVELTAQAGIVLASDTARAVATARMLAPGREIVESPLFRELDLEGPALGRLRMPLRAWSFAVGGRILVQMLRRAYPSESESERIRRASRFLNDLASEHALIVVVTHAMFRRRLAAELVRTGWQAEEGRRSMEHWSTWTLRATPTKPNEHTT
jgi:broad specificity phosphatase PhoE